MSIKELTKNALDESRALHEASVIAILNFLKKRDISAIRILVDPHINGDIEFLSATNFKKSLLVKAEEGNRYGNFFFETFRDKDKNELGWTLSNLCKADYLGYHFRTDGHLYVIDLPNLKNWFKQNLYKFKELEQKKRVQKNSAWGKIVPITTLSRELTVHEYENVF